MTNACSDNPTTSQITITCDELAALAPVTQARLKHHVFVCLGPSCAPKGSQAVLEKFWEVLRYKGMLYGKRGIKELQHKASVLVASCGSVGLCSVGPAVLIYPEGIWYYNVQPDDVEEIVNEHLIYGNPVKRLMACEIAK